MKPTFIATVAFGVALIATPAAAQTKVSIGISGWTGFAPLTLAKEAGIFAKNGLDVTIKKIPQASRHLAIASGDIQCAATTVETWVVWNANGVATTQIFQLDKSYGADGMVVRNNIGSIKDVKGKTVAASAPGTAPYFTLAWFLKKNGLTVKDVTVVNMEPGPAAQAFLAGQNDVAMTYEPYLSAVREKPDAGKIIATTLDYPMIYGHIRLHAKISFGERSRGQGTNQELFRRGGDDQGGAGQVLRNHGCGREAARR
jgi:NitT/TauT family transport system substrate-binding protein